MVLREYFKELKRIYYNILNEYGTQKSTTLTRMDNDTPSTKHMANPFTLVDQLKVVELENWKKKNMS